MYAVLQYRFARVATVAYSANETWRSLNNKKKSTKGDVLWDFPKEKKDRKRGNQTDTLGEMEKEKETEEKREGDIERGTDN